MIPSYGRWTKWKDIRKGMFWLFHSFAWVNKPSKHAVLSSETHFHTTLQDMFLVVLVV